MLLLLLIMIAVKLKTTHWTVQILNYYFKALSAGPAPFHAPCFIPHSVLPACLFLANYITHFKLGSNLFHTCLHQYTYIYACTRRWSMKIFIIKEAKHWLSSNVNSNIVLVNLRFPAFLMNMCIKTQQLSYWRVAISI